VVQKFIFNIDMKEEIEKYYHDNGELNYETPYRNGKRHGLAKWWNENGLITREALYVNGQIHGLVKHCWYSDGQIMFEVPYKNDIEFGAKIYFYY